MLLIKKLVFCSEKTSLTLTSEEKSDDIEIEEKDALAPNNRKGHTTTNPLTPEDKAIKIPNKKLLNIQHSKLFKATEHSKSLLNIQLIMHTL